eukprot:358035-Chlamydomonas_euryale.AAC.1
MAASGAHQWRCAALGQRWQGRRAGSRVAIRRIARVCATAMCGISLLLRRTNKKAYVSCHAYIAWDACIHVHAPYLCIACMHACVCPALMHHVTTLVHCMTAGMHVHALHSCTSRVCPAPHACTAPHAPHHMHAHTCTERTAACLPACLHACMQYMHEGSRAFTLVCESEAGWSVHKTCAETGGRDKHVLCKDDPAKVSHAGKREDRPLMHTA